MKTKMLVAASLVAFTLPASLSAQPARAPAASVLVVDTSRVLRECTACVSATAALQAMQTSYQQRTQALAGPLQAEEQSIQQAAQAASNLTGAARTTAETALRPRIQAFEQRRQAAAQELQQLQQNFESTRVNVSMQLSQRLDPIYRQLMASRGANLMVSAESTLAHTQSLEVTNEVLAALNASTPAVSVTPMPQQQPAPGQTPQPQQPRPQGR